MKIESLSNDVIFHANYPIHLKDSLIKKVMSFVYNIFSILIFPIGICRLIAYQMHIALGYYFFLPSQFLSKKNMEYLDQGRKNLIKNFNAKEINLETADKVKLNGIFILGKDRLGKKLTEKAPLIIHYLGNAGRYEDFGHHQEAIKDLSHFNLLIVNYRGVCKSQSMATKKGLILDAEAILEFALKKLKISEDKIILHGHSFGGALATLVASNHNVKLLNDRSFSTLEEAVYHNCKKIFQTLICYFLIMPFVLLEKLIPQKEVEKVRVFIKDHNIFNDNVILKPHFLTKIINVISHIMADIFSKLTVLFGWDFSPKVAWRNVKGKKMILFLKKDGLIPYKASFFKGVRKCSDQFIRISNSNMYHSSALPTDLIKRIFRQLNG